MRRPDCEQAHSETADDRQNHGVGWVQPSPHPGTFGLALGDPPATPAASAGQVSATSTTQVTSTTGAFQGCERQPTTGAFSSAYASAAVPAVTVTEPARSNRPSPAALLSLTRR